MTMTKMSDTDNKKPKLKHFHHHVHHTFKIPGVSVTIFKSTDVKDWKVPSTVIDLWPCKEPTCTTRSELNKSMWLLEILTNKMAARCVTIFSFIVLVAVMLLPKDIQSKTSSNPSISNDGKVKPGTFVYFVYLASFSLHIGSQFWMTIVSGMSLYINWSRFAFSDVPKILFPQYILVNCIMSAITMEYFNSITRDLWDLGTYIQVITFILCFLLELMVWVFLVPSIMRLTAAKKVIEKSEGLGMEVGHCKLGRLVECPHYVDMHQSFRKMHAIMAMGYIITMMCSAYHLLYTTF